MKKLTCLFTIFCISIFLNGAFAQSMDPTSPYELRRTGKESDRYEYDDKEDIVLSLEKQVTQGHVDPNALEIARRKKRELEGIVGVLEPLVALVLKLEELTQQETSSESEDLDTLSLAEKYKDAFLITRLPEEQLLIANQSLENSIKILMKLSMLNTGFNAVWTPEKIGDLFKKHYSDEDRAAMIYLLFRCRNIRPCLYMPLAIAIRAGFGKENDEINEYLLLRVTGRAGFLPIVELLFKNKANPNITTQHNYPLLFNVKTAEEAQLFVANDVDLHVVLSARYGDYFKVNVLWFIVQKDYPSDLMKFYLDKHVDPRVLNHRGECLLHELVDKFCTVKDNIDDYFKKIELLLDAIPDKINLISRNWCTPTGMLMDMEKKEADQGYRLKSKEDYERFIALLRQHGGRTQLELQPWYKEGMSKI